ncbi:MAG: phosphate ABC transporter substrate-binding protein [Proteobacteria bacterium]|nr:phosphate ABC transporter substrate-binding protein [Pseudomonadota bacterium]
MKAKLKYLSLAVALAGASLAARADVVVVVSAKSAVTSLTADQVAQIFLGKSESFPNGTQAVPIDQSEASAPYADFYTKVVGKDNAQIKAYWSKQVFTGKSQPPKGVSGNNEVKKLVADNPNLIGYIEKGTADSSVKVVFGH